MKLSKIVLLIWIVGFWMCHFTTEKRHCYDRNERRLLAHGKRRSVDADWRVQPKASLARIR